MNNPDPPDVSDSDLLDLSAEKLAALKEIEEADKSRIYLHRDSEEYTVLNIKIDNTVGAIASSSARLHAKIEAIKDSLEAYEADKYPRSMTAREARQAFDATESQGKQIATLLEAVKALQEQMATASFNSVDLPQQAAVVKAKVPWWAIEQAVRDLAPNTPALLPGATEEMLTNLRANLGRKLKAVGIQGSARITQDDQGIWVTLSN